MFDEYSVSVRGNKDLIMDSALKAAIMRVLGDVDLPMSLLNTIGWTKLRVFCPTSRARRECRRAIAITSLIIEPVVVQHSHTIAATDQLNITYDMHRSVITVTGETDDRRAR